jgi:glycosyltransferase involved in cell wall biosynthesis
MIHVTHIMYLSEKLGQNPISGAENHIIMLVKGLKEKGIDVELIVLLWNNGPLVSSVLNDLKNKGICVEVIAREKNNKNNHRLYRALKCWYKLYLALLQRKIRAIHVHLDLIAVILVAWLAGCKRIIITIHNDEKHYAKINWRIWLRIINRIVSAYIAITNHVKDYFISVAGIKTNKISTIYYGIDNLAPSQVSRRDYQIPLNSYVVGFIGRLTEQKNLKVFIDALSELPDIIGIIVGDGVMEEELQSIILKKKINNIIFLGAISNAYTLIPLFDIFCLPSKWEGLGVVLLEAMKQKIPIIGSKAGAIPEILGNGKYGLLFDTNNSASLKEKILYAKENPEMVKQICIQAFDYVNNVFTIEKMVNETIKVYKGNN